MYLDVQRAKLLGVTALGLTLACVGPGCGGSSKKNTNANPQSSSGGAASGDDAPGAGGASENEEAGVSNVPCENNADCTPLGMVCDTFISKCVTCAGPSCSTSTGDHGAGGCLSSGGNPCSEIPSFVGTQVVDGQGNEFCNIAPMQLDADNAAKVISYNAEPPEVLTARIATSSAGLHAYIEVVDSSVQSVDMVDPNQAISQAYQGDSVELLFSSSNNVSGLTGTDANTLHVIIPAQGPAVSTKASNSNNVSGGTATALPSSQYAQRITSTGYAIEALLPWPGGTAPSPGSNIRFDLALNSADTTFGNVGDMRDGQLIYHLETVSDTTCQGTSSAEGTVPFCDDRAWCVTTLGD
jgi:hypothetical protein